MTKIFVLVLLLMFSAHPVQAEDYVSPTWPSLLRTLVRFGALPLSEDTLLDDYALVTECKLYSAFYKDDFKWKQVRDAIRESVKSDVATFPVAYGYVTRLQLDRYDFDDKLFRFSAKATIQNINTFTVFRTSDPNCGTARVKFVPKAYRIVLSAPVYVPGLPLTQTDAKALLDEMKIDHNDARIVYTKFNFRVTHVDPLRINYSPTSTMYFTQGKGGSVDQPMRLDAHLDSVEFFEDEGMTRLIYKFLAG